MKMSAKKHTKQASGKHDMRVTRGNEVVSKVGSMHKATSTKASMKKTRYA